MNLTDALEVYARLTDVADGIPPTAREFALALGKTSSNTAHRWMLLLEEEGLIATHPEILARRVGGRYAQVRSRIITERGRMHLLIAQNAREVS